MSSNFSTIGPLNPATISKMPAHTAANNQTQQAPAKPVASSPIAPEKKSSHSVAKWIGGLIVAAVVVVGGLGLARKNIKTLNEINVKEALPEGTKLKDKALYYISKAGAYINEQAIKLKNQANELYTKAMESFKKKD